MINVFLGYDDNSWFEGSLNETHEHGYKERYTDNRSVETFFLGFVSLALTLINILCIIITGILILKLKEVTPAKVPQKFAQFWRRDVKAHRNYYTAIRKGEKLDELNIKDDKDAWSTLPFHNDNILQSMWERAAQDEELANIRDWVVMPSSASERTPRADVLQDPWSQSRQNQPHDIEKNQKSRKKLLLNTNNIYDGDSLRSGYNTISHGNYLNVPQFLHREVNSTGKVKNLRQRFEKKS